MSAKAPGTARTRRKGRAPKGEWSTLARQSLAGHRDTVFGNESEREMKQMPQDIDVHKNRTRACRGARDGTEPQ